MAQCKAKSKQSGKRCKRRPVPGREVCTMHGGASPPAGPLHPNFKTGRYSKVLDGRPIAELYEEARNDPRLLQLNEEIALLVSRQKQTLKGLSTGENDYTWSHAQRVWQRLVNARTSGSTKAEGLAYLELGAIITGANRDALVWREYEERTEVIRRLVDTERKYQEMQGRILPPDRSSLIMNILLDLIRRHVEAEAVRTILEEFRATFRAQSPLTLGRSINAEG